MVLKNRHHFEYPHFTYLIMYNFTQTWRLVHEMKEQFAGALLIMFKLRYLFR